MHIAPLVFGAFLFMSATAGFCTTAALIDRSAQSCLSEDNVIYAVYQDGDLIRCIDSSTGAIVGTINFTGTIIQGPNVSGNRCTVVIDNYLGKKGTVYKLPMFDVVTTFDVKP